MPEQIKSDLLYPTLQVAAPPAPTSVHTHTFADFLQQSRISIAVTTYQAGKLILLRSDEAKNRKVVNTHFRDFQRPMGFAWQQGRCAIGTKNEVWEFHDIPAVAKKLQTISQGRGNDAVFVPRVCHYTGDIQIHEMAWIDPELSPGRNDAPMRSELWFVNTRFSCLSTRSDEFSFVPKWRPKFVSALAPEDRCHLNGMAVRDARVRYATALAETDVASGWRSRKVSGGIVMDIVNDEIISRGLSMPHSPRWHRDRLWILESGKGGFGYVDQKTGKYEEICRLPGFTRGLDFVDEYALVGLSEVRESAVFSGIPITECPPTERTCGVWILDIFNGRTVAFVRFTDVVQEIFSVQALRASWPDLLTQDSDRVAETFELPDEALQSVPVNLR